jgi:antitoxin (DNA-binding transcriptional repressor) of toxin-antitoxin stability system
MNAATLPISVTATEFTRGISDYLSQVQYRGQVIDISRGKKVIARVTPIDDQPKGLTAGQVEALLASLPPLSREERESFAADIAAGRVERASTRDPWED